MVSRFLAIFTCIAKSECSRRHSASTWEKELERLTPGWKLGKLSLSERRFLFEALSTGK